MISDREFIPKGDPTMLKRAIARSTSPKEAAMTSKQMKAEGWIEHDGGPCPVADEAYVSPMFRSGRISPYGPAYCFVWHDIIAYKPEGTPNDQ